MFSRQKVCKSLENRNRKILKKTFWHVWLTDAVDFEFFHRFARWYFMENRLRVIVMQEFSSIQSRTKVNRTYEFFFHKKLLSLFEYRPLYVLFSQQSRNQTFFPARKWDWVLVNYSLKKHSLMSCKFIQYKTGVGFEGDSHWFKKYCECSII